MLVALNDGDVDIVAQRIKALVALFEEDPRRPTVQGGASYPKDASA